MSDIDKVDGVRYAAGTGKCSRFLPVPDEILPGEVSQHALKSDDYQLMLIISSKYKVPPATR